MSTVPPYISVDGHLYRLAANTFQSNTPEAGIPDPTEKIELNDSQTSAIARAIIIALAYTMYSAGIKTAADMKKYDENALLRQLPQLLQSVARQQSVFNREIRTLASKGPVGYLKMEGQSLQALK